MKFNTAQLLMIEASLVPENERHVGLGRQKAKLSVIRPSAQNSSPSQIVRKSFDLPSFGFSQGDIEKEQ